MIKEQLEEGKRKHDSRTPANLTCKMRRFWTAGQRWNHPWPAAQQQQQRCRKAALHHSHSQLPKILLLDNKQPPAALKPLSMHGSTVNYPIKSVCSGPTGPLCWLNYQLLTRCRTTEWRHNTQQNWASQTLISDVSRELNAEQQSCVPEFPVQPWKSALNKQVGVCWALCWSNKEKLV